MFFHPRIGPMLALLPMLVVLAIPAMAAPATVVNVELNDMGDVMTLKTDKTTVPAGRVTFIVNNMSMTEEHEMILVKTKLTPAEFPTNKDGSRVTEDKFKGAEEVSELKPGANGKLTETLKPGHYVMFCNVKNHFKDGMYAELTVTQ